MRRTLYLIVVLMLILTACGGDGDSNDATSPPNEPLSDEAATFAAEVDDVLADATPVPLISTAAPVDDSALVVAPPGELVASETEDPEPRGMFDYISMQQEGGRENTVITIEIYNDGRVTLNGAEGRIGLETINQIDETINRLNFFGMQGTLLGSPGGDDIYYYRVSVQRGFQARTISAQDGYIPDEFLSLLAMIRGAGESIQ